MSEDLNMFTKMKKGMKKVIEGMQPQINDMERRLGIMQSVELVLTHARFKNFRYVQS